MKYIVCFSGGHTSAICAIRCVRKFGKENVILLNHDIVDDSQGNEIEHKDIKRFKQEVADYLGLTITYANCRKFKDNTPLGVVEEIGSFINIHTKQALCTTKLKTEPFYEYLKTNFSENKALENDECKVVYGFDINEKERITRRVGVLSTVCGGYLCEFPMLWEDKNLICNTEEIGIKRPLTYKLFKHANCVGCLKAGRQHWYLVYCLYPKIFERAKKSEEQIGATIIKGISLTELEPKYKEMKESLGICPNENQQSQTFWARVEKVCPEQISFLPCDCAVL